MSDKPAPPATPEDRSAAFRRFEEVMRKLVRVPKKELDEKIAAERAAKKPRRRPA